jgi:hypothetical protein
VGVAFLPLLLPSLLLFVRTGDCDLQVASTTVVKDSVNPDFGTAIIQIHKICYGQVRFLSCWCLCASRGCEVVLSCLMLSPCVC